MKVLETERLLLHHLDAASDADARFILALLNQPSWLRYIGDRGVRTLEDARAYIESGPAASYRANGFGLYRVELKADAVPVGICGLLRRPPLDDPDLGFAFLPEHWGKGYALEAASAVMAHARDVLGLERLAAVVTPDNHPSIRLLEKLGFHHAGAVRMAEGEPEIRLYSTG